MARGGIGCDLSSWLPLLPTPTTPGDWPWGQVRDSSGSVGGPRGRIEEHAQNGITARKATRALRLLRLTAQRLSLHGKEGVDGSSPSEGLSGTMESLQKRLSCCRDRHRRAPPSLGGARPID